MPIGGDLSQNQNHDSKTTNGKDRLRILHVDDDSDFLEVSKEIFELEGNFEVDTALSVDEACQKLDFMHYDAVISDYDMPKKDGLQFLKELREQKNEISFILFTGKGREEVAIKALNLGADGYINKQGGPETVYGELAHSVRQSVTRKNAELELKQKNEVLEKVGEGIDAGLAIIGKDYAIVWANKRLMDLGITPNKKCHQTFNNLGVVCPECGVERVFEQNVSLDVHEYKTVNSKGETIWTELRVTPFKDKNGITIAALVLAIPITERKRIENEISLNKAYLESLLNTVLSGIMVVDAKTHEIVDVNSYALTLLGATRTQVVGEVCHKFVCPAEKGKCPATDLGQNVFHSERVLLALNGNKIPIIKSVVSYKAGETTYLIESFVDISERKNAEIQIKDSSRRIEMVNEKLRVVGGLTRHDVRNKLSAVTGNAFLLKKKHANQPDIIDGLGKMEEAVKEVAKIFDFAKMYEQLGVEELTYVDVEKTVDEAAALFSGLTIKLINECHGLTVLADSFLRQLFYNFIDNTKKHGKKATAIRVYFEKAESGELRVIYEDDGVGISTENKLKLFTESFSTEGSTGFGLFLIKKMIDIYGWQIQETGQSGKGAKFTITIPRLNKKGKKAFDHQDKMVPNLDSVALLQARLENDILG